MLKTLFPRLLLRRKVTINNVEINEERYIFSDAYVCVKSFIFELFDNEENLFQIMLKIDPLDLSLFEFFIENYFCNPLKECSKKSIKMLSKLCKASKIAFDENDVGTRFLVTFLKETPGIQIFLCKILTKSLQYIILNRENLEVDSIRVNDPFEKNQMNFYSYKTLHILNTFKPESQYIQVNISI